jgi:hypothetical protein
MSEYSNVIAVGIGAFGLMLSAATIYEVVHGTLLGALPLMIGIALYVLMAPLLYFVLLGTAHDAMRQAKDAELLRLSKMIQDAYSRLTSAGTDAKKVTDLQTMYAAVERFPVWPFEMVNVTPLVTRVYASLLPGLISIIVRMVAEQF